MPHQCDLTNCDGTRLGHELARDFPKETERITDALDRRFRVDPRNLQVEDEEDQ